MKRVTGIGGIFFKCKDPENLKKWYAEHLGIPADKYGAVFQWKDSAGGEGHTVWSPFKSDTEYFHPSPKDFMINYRVENLEELLKDLKSEGVEISGDMEVYDYGKFGWIVDPEGNKLELWEPNDEEFRKLGSSS